MSLRSLLGILPFLTTGLWAAFSYFRSIETSRSWRWALALGGLLLGGFSLMLTELLSAVHLLSFSPVLIGWCLFAALPAFLLFQKKETIDVQKEIVHLRAKISTLPLWALIIFGGAGLLIVIMAVATPPMNFDVQIYHLPRQIYWLMQASVEPFAASHTHQISMPVLSEFLGLNLLIISGSDAWHNLIQTLFLLATCGLVSLLAKSLKGSPRAQIFSLLYLILVPVLFFEASNAKNDIILSFFVLIPLLIGMRCWNNEWDVSIPLLLLAAFAAGLALATKGTALAYLLPSAVLLVVVCVRSGAIRELLLAFLPALLLAILPAAPQLVRNMEVFHSAAGPNLHHSNLSHDPLSIMGVAIRNITGQFTCGSETWNLALEHNTRRFLTLLGIDADDPKTTFEGQNFHLPYFAGLEDIVPAPAQTTLLLLLPLGFLFHRFRKSPGILPIFLVTAASLFFFCLIFRWQPWQGRLLIPGYVMAAPMAGILLDQLRPQWLPILFVLLELLALRPHLMFAGQRPLLGGSSIFRMSQKEQMSRMMPGRAEEIETIVSSLKQEGIHTIMVDGGATEIYGLLREIHKTLPLVMISSGHATHPLPVDFVITTTTRDAGVPPPSIDPHPVAPPGFKIFYSGSYYRTFSPIQAAKNNPK